MRYSDTELSLIANTFRNNDGLIIALRNYFLQLGLSPSEQSLINLAIVGKKEVTDVIRKTLLPELEPNAPLLQQVDLFLTVDIKEKSIEDASLAIQARKVVVDYLQNMIGWLENSSHRRVSLADLALVEDVEPRQMVINHSARNTLVNHINQQVFQLKVLAGQDEETPEETKARLFKNSNR